MMYKDRQEAAFLLAEKLIDYQDCDGIVIALPRGGVPLGFVIACYSHLPLRLMSSKNTKHPGYKNFTIGTISRRREAKVLCNENMVAGYVESETERIQSSHKGNDGNYPHYELISLMGKKVIVIDEGIAENSKMEEVLRYVKSGSPEEIVVATPVASKNELIKLKDLADKIICLHQPGKVNDVGKYYEKFDQLTEENVIDYLKRAEALQI